MSDKLKSPVHAVGKADEIDLALGLDMRTSAQIASIIIFSGNIDCNSQAPPTFECYCQFYGESNLPFCACFFSFLSEFCGAGLISLNQWWDGSGCRP